MEEGVYVITATNVRNTGSVSFRFMRDSEAPFRDFSLISSQWGTLLVREVGENEISNPFKFVRGEADDTTHKWQLDIFKSGQGFLLSASAEETEEGLHALFEGWDDPLEAVSCVLLTTRDVWDRLKVVFEKVGIPFGVHHFDGELATS